MQNIVISKIRCAAPNKRGTAVANINHLKYIATREGVDLSPSSKHDAEDDTTTYLRYIHERPRSHGLFGNLPDEQIDDIDTLCQNMYQLSKNKPIYKGIVSLAEEDAINLGYDDKKSWETMLNASMPDIAHEFNIPITSLAWVGAMHQEQGHPHVHYMFWRTDDKIQSPFIPTATQNKCREIFAKYIDEDEREIYIAEKAASRDTLINMEKELFIPGTVQTGVLGRINHKLLENIAEQLENLAKALPNTGRTAYQFLPPDIKIDVDCIVDTVLQIPNFTNEYTNYVNAVNNISHSYSVVGNKKIRNLKRAEKDLKNRLSNIVIKEANKVRKTKDYLNSITSQLLNAADTVPSVIDNDKSTNRQSDTMPPSSSDLIIEDEEELSINIEIHIDDEMNGTSNTINTPLQRNPHPNSSNKQIKQRYSNGRGSKRGPNYWTPTYKEAKRLLYNQKQDGKEGEDAPEDDIHRSEKILSLLKSEADSLNPLALMDLGWIYDKGILDIPQDSNLAQTYYTSGYNQMLNICNSNNTSEEDFLTSYFSYRLGKCYSSGTGVEKDLSSAKKYYRTSISTSPEGNPNAYAEYALAKIYMKELKEAESMEDTEKPILDFTVNELVSLYQNAAQSSPFAAYDLAQLYADGYLVNIDIVASRELYSTALSGFCRLVAKNPNDSMLYKIGKMYLHGLGTEKNVDEAITYLTQSAELKNEFAIYELAKLYLKKDVPTDIDIDKLINWLIEISIKESKDENSDIIVQAATAKYYLGRIYLSDTNTPYDDSEKGLEFLMDSMRSGNTYALAEIINVYRYTDNAEMLLHMPDIFSSLETMVQAEEDEVKANGLYYSSFIYLKEQGNFFNIEKGLQALSDAADLGNTQALSELIKNYLKDDSYHQYIDIEKTVNLLKDASVQTNISQKASAMHFLNLGRIYAYEDYKDYNLPSALNYFSKASELGNTKAPNEMAKLYLKNSSDYPDDPQKIVLLLNATLETPNIDDTVASMALYYLGRITAYEDYKNYDMDKAIELFFKSASLSNDFAIYELAKIYIYDIENRYSTLDIKQVIAKLQVIAQSKTDDAAKDNISKKNIDAAHVSQAQFLLGKIYAKQDSGTYDLNLAIKYLQQSADSDNIYSQAALGSIYLWGRHGVKDVELGKMWLQKSADSGNENALSQIELYDKIQKQNFIYSSYGLLKCMFNSLLSQSQQAQSNEYATRSKKSQKELKRKNPTKDSYLE